jgi:Cu-Zn family superoxide dismutase
MRKHHHTRKHLSKHQQSATAIAVIRSPNNSIDGDVVVTPYKRGIKLDATFRALPPGKHGFHIHRAGDLRGEGCKGLCAHYDKGNHTHGAGPTSTRGAQRHTGDLGNIELKPRTKTLKKRYYLPNVAVHELWGRSIIVHQDADDLGKGNHDDSHITGHSGARIGCAVFGRG